MGAWLDENKIYFFFLQDFLKVLADLCLVQVFWSYCLLPEFYRALDSLALKDLWSGFHRQKDSFFILEKLVTVKLYLFNVPTQNPHWKALITENRWEEVIDCYYSMYLVSPWISWLLPLLVMVEESFRNWEILHIHIYGERARERENLQRGGEGQRERERAIDLEQREENKWGQTTNMPLPFTKARI